MKRFALCLTVIACAALAGCIIVPDRHWHHVHYGAAGAATAPLQVAAATAQGPLR